MSIAEEIERLEQLRRNGTLSDEEFRLAKQRVIAGERDQGTRFTQPGFLEPPDRALAERRWAMFLHLSLLAGLVVPGAGLALPIILWQVKKDEFPILDQHGRNAVNWIISALIYGAAGVLLAFVGIGLVLLGALAFCAVLFPILAAVKANDGRVWAYPLSIRFLSTGADSRPGTPGLS
jgi:uncharacterized Tic20 family protein